jgi:uncharacterized protein
MQFSNQFEVSLPPAQAWALLMDIRRIAPCMPGAELTNIVDNDTYQGKVSVRMGPVVLAFAGTAKIEERDDIAHTARVKAQGNDSKGRGGANAAVKFAILPSGNGSKILIDTDLNLTGSVAQYGRGAGVIQSIASQLTNQFSKSLEKQIAPGDREIAALPPLALEAKTPDAAAEPPPKPIGGASLLFRALWMNILAVFGSRGAQK